MTVATHEAPGAARRVLDVARIQSVNRMLLVGTPLGVLAAAFVINIAVFAAIGDVAPPGARMSGALLSIYIATGVTHLQTMTQLFPFAIGISVTRRAFYAGTAFVVVVQSALFGLMITLFGVLEGATRGWGLQLYFFRLAFLPQNLLLQWLAYTGPFLAISAVFVFTGVVFKRWGQLGVYVVTVGAALLLGAPTVVVTWLRLWPSVGEFFVDSSALALLAGYPSVLAVLVGVAGYLAIRRATP